MNIKQIYELDNKRRITLPKDISEKYGSTFVIVRLRDDVLLKPIPKDPIKALQEEGRKLENLNSKALRKEFEKRVLERE